VQVCLPKLFDRNKNLRLYIFCSLQLYDRKLAVRLDKQPGMTPEELAQLPNRWPILKLKNFKA
jgi:hypothetical protein